MCYSTLITPEELLPLLEHEEIVILDCRHNLADLAMGERAYARSHLPGARFFHLDRDLSGPMNGKNGRHPLPDREVMARRFAAAGISNNSQVVAYDQDSGAMATRAWWLLRWLGHDHVAVLDGGLPAWVAAGGPLETAPGVARPAAPYPARAEAMPTVQAADLQRQLGRRPVIDARAAERFRGEVEPLDPVAGHIPGALNRFFKDNLQPDGRFKPAATLRSEWAGLAADPAQVVHQCGSGVTACHNLLAMEHAGLAGSALYPGSWSEWCADPARPVARG